MNRLDLLFEQIRACRLCEARLPLGPRPVIRGSERARLLIIGRSLPRITGLGPSGRWASPRRQARICSNSRSSRFMA